MISQFPDEWSFLAQQQQRVGGRDESQLYLDFIHRRLPDDIEEEVRFWAAYRMQSVAKTVIGALQYANALMALPKVQDYYENRDYGPDDHAEVILAHQSYGLPGKAREENDASVLTLLRRYKNR